MTELTPFFHPFRVKIIRHTSICDGEAAYYNSREELQIFRIIFDGPLEHFYG